MFKLASIIVRDGALGVPDAVGWTVRLAVTLEIIHRVGAAHGRISPKALQVLGKSYQAGGFVLDAPDLADDVAYQSPERLDGGQPSTQDDTWAAGVTLYELLTGMLPFPGTTASEVLAKTLGRPPTPLSDYGVAGARLQRVLSRTFLVDPARRIRTIGELKQQLVVCEPECDELPPLKLGKPDLSLFEDTSDDDGANLTAVVDVPVAVLQARLQAKSRASGGPAEPAGAAESSDGDGELDDEPPTRVVEQTPEALQEIARKIAESAARRQAALAVPGVDGPVRTAGDAAVAADDVPRLPGLLDDDTDWGYDPAEPDVPRSASSASSASAVSEKDPVAVDVAEPAPPEPASVRHAGPPSSRAEPSSARAAAEPAVERPPAARPRSPTRKSGRLLDTLLSLAFLCAGGGAAYFLYGTDLDHWRGRWAELVSRTTGAQPPATASGPSGKPSAAQPPAATASSAAAAPPSTSATAVEAVPSSSTAAAADPTTAPSATSTAAASASAGDLKSCMIPLFPEDTFAFTKPYFDFVCTETNARKGGNNLRIQVIRSGGGAKGVTEGMREWAELGWYEMAIFTVARTLCCPDAEPLETPGVTADCALDPSLQQLGDAVASGDDAAVDAAVTEYTKTVHCLARAGAVRAFGQSGLPGSRATGVFRTVIKRARQVARSR